MAVSISRDSIGLRFLQQPTDVAFYEYPYNQSSSRAAYTYGLCREPYLSSYQPMAAGFGHWDYTSRLRVSASTRAEQPSYYQTLLSLHAARAGLVPPTFINPRSFKTFYIDEEKPNQSYIGLIGQAIMSSPENKMVLNDIYKWVLTHYPYFRNKGPGWKNSVRHNLSLNDCFVKAGRSPNGKGNFWAINPDNYEDFRRGDFRRRRAQRRLKKFPSNLEKKQDEESVNSSDELCLSPDIAAKTPAATKQEKLEATTTSGSSSPTKCETKLRTFDVENLLRI